jgi:hypothetical protein
MDEFVVITGLSAAGRSLAADDLEDLGWFVIDLGPVGRGGQPGVEDGDGAAVGGGSDEPAGALGQQGGGPGHVDALPEAHGG